MLMLNGAMPAVAFVVKGQYSTWNVYPGSAVPGFCRPLKRARMGMGDVVNEPPAEAGGYGSTQASPAVREAYAAVAIATTFRTRSESDVVARNARVRSVAPGFEPGLGGRYVRGVPYVSPDSGVRQSRGFAMSFVLQRASGRGLALTQVRGKLLRIGRGTNAELRSENPAVALEHAVIEGDATGFTITDKGSITGTYVNRRPVETARLSRGDVIEIGDLRIEVQVLEAGKPLFLRVSSTAAATGGLSR